MIEGKSKFIILYHRTPFEESTNEEGELIWVDHKSPNGIIPTLRNLFKSKPGCLLFAWVVILKLMSTAFMII